MTDRSTWYAHQCIAASGLAVMEPRIAFQLRTDLWSGLQDCAITFRLQQRLEGTKRLVVTFPTWGRVEVYARSLNNLEQRLEWIVGERPTEIAEWQPERPEVTPEQAARREANRKEIERLAELRNIATQEPPSHDCHRRREILEARQKLGMS